MLMLMRMLMPMPNANANAKCYCQCQCQMPTPSANASCPIQFNSIQFTLCIWLFYCLLICCLLFPLLLLASCSSSWKTPIPKRTLHTRWSCLNLRSRLSRCGGTSSSWWSKSQSSRNSTTFCFPPESLTKSPSMALRYVCWLLFLTFAFFSYDFLRVRLVGHIFGCGCDWEGKCGKGSFYSILFLLYFPLRCFGQMHFFLCFLFFFLPEVRCPSLFPFAAVVVHFVSRTGMPDSTYFQCRFICDAFVHAHKLSICAFAHLSIGTF